MTDLSEMQIKVLHRIEDLADHEIRVVEIKVDGERMLGIAGYSVSAEVYGPTVVFEKSVLPRLLENLEQTDTYYNGRRTEPGENQERLRV